MQEVQIINEELLGISKAEYLVDAQKEKILRASLKSNVEKYLDANRVVILDSMNYIKGFRYELYCLVRNAKTSLCIVWCDTHPEIAAKICSEAGYENQFPEDLFEDYSSRLEKPNQAQRWDKPLF
jgi:protein KTI12